MQDLQQIYFDLIDKNEAIKLFNEGKETILLLHDDLTESAEPSLEDIQKHEGRFGKEKNSQLLIAGIRGALDEVYAALLRVKECKENPENEDITNHYDCNEDEKNALETLRYITGN